MNAEVIQKKLEEYYAKATPEQVVKEFEALGVEFVVIPEMVQVQVGLALDFAFEFNANTQSMLADFLVPSPEQNPSGYSSIIIAPTQPAILHQGVVLQEGEVLVNAGEYQYAMAA